MARSSYLNWLVDRYAGIALVNFLRVFKSKRLLTHPIERIGIIQPTAIGDMILCSGLINDLLIRFDNAELHLFHGISNRAAIGLLPEKVRTHCSDFKNILRTAREIRAENIDVLIDLCPWPRATAIITFLSGAKYCVGFDTPSQFRHYLYDSAVKHSDERHEVENISAMTTVFGAYRECLPVLKISGPASGMERPVDRMVIFHTSAGGSMARFKNWPDENWVVLGDALIRAGYHVGFTGTANDTAKVGRLIAQLRCPDQALSLCGSLSLVSLAAILRDVAAVVSIDTSILHLASAANANLVALHGPTSSRRWGPLNPKGIALDSPHASAGYMSLGFERHKDEAFVMAAITVADVIPAIEHLLGISLVDGTTQI